MDDLLITLRETNRRLGRLVDDSTQRIVASSADPLGMRTMYGALSGDLSASDGLEALRAALRADGLDDDQISGIESLYLTAIVGV